jgi:hypothetical protein
MTNAIATIDPDVSCYDNEYYDPWPADLEPGPLDALGLLNIGSAMGRESAYAQVALSVFSGLVEHGNDYMMRSKTGRRDMLRAAGQGSYVVKILNALDVLECLSDRALGFEGMSVRIAEERKSRHIKAGTSEHHLSPWDRDYSIASRTNQAWLQKLKRHFPFKPWRF